jgi:excisionase family DNA binding protein
MKTAAPRTMEDLIRRMTPVAAPPEQRAQVAALSKALEGMLHLQKRRAPKCQLVGPKGESIPLPESVFYVLERVAEVLSRGDSITVVPVGREVTTQQGADLLNVSRQYLVRLLDEGRIPFRKTGKHRRLQIEDVLAFKEQLSFLCLSMWQAWRHLLGAHPGGKADVGSLGLRAVPAWWCRGAGGGVRSASWRVTKTAKKAALVRRKLTDRSRSPRAEVVPKPSELDAKSLDRCTGLRCPSFILHQR